MFQCTNFGFCTGGAVCYSMYNLSKYLGALHSTVMTEGQTVIIMNCTAWHAQNVKHWDKCDYEAKVRFIVRLDSEEGEKDL